MSVGTGIWVGKRVSRYAGIFGRKVGALAGCTPWSAAR